MRLNRRLGSESGQSLVLAVIVMFLLVFLGIMFIVIISRNLTRAARSTDVTEATALAEAGIRYADRMLTMSEDGADWRPAPDNLDLATNGDHPDFKWLRKYDPVEASDGSAGPTGGFTSFSSGNGRFLLRLTYAPDPEDPLSKYIKIESIGRVGFVDKNDPTTYGPASKVSLRRELTAYKPIGLTDYCRFITNKEKRSTPITLGCSGYPTQLGRDVNGEPVRGAPIRVNGNLKWAGSQVDLYLRGKDIGGGKWLPIDTVEVAGTIDQESVDTPRGSSPINVIVHQIVGLNKTDVTVGPSSWGDNFDTASGFYRDGSPDPDRYGFARDVKRVEPPLIDDPNPSTKLTRYRTLTLNSGEWRLDPDGTTRYNTGRIGWGKGVYINNRRDKQAESETLFGGYSLTKDWTKPDNDMSAYWKGPYYVPPGCIIVLNPDDTDGDDQPDMTITRTDIEPRTQNKTVWRDYYNDPRPDWGQTVTMPYPTPSRKVNVLDSSGDPIMVDLPGNGVVYAEGNIRIRGMLPKGVQLTVVSNGTIYIEGDILKNRVTDRNGAVTTDTTSAIALLAENYICVNTTQFVSLLTEVGPMSIGSDAMNGEPPYHLIITPETSSNFRSLFTFGPPDLAGQVDPRIFVRHAGQYGPTYVNMFINPQINPPPTSLYNWTLPGYGNMPFFGVGDSAFAAAKGTGAIGGGQTTLFWGDVWGLVGGNHPQLNWDVGYPNYLEIGLDQHPFSGLNILVVPEIRNYLLSSFAIQPMDVRIEAILYAQEDSFFVIPGPWFNPDPDDYNGSPVNARYQNGRPPGIDPLFPYFGQGLDVKITLDGAITENLPASPADVSEWMAKWGKIPEYYGSTTEPTAHPGQGVTFLYDPLVGWPVDSNGYIRRDDYNRALPITPKLPVCTSLVYFGDAP